MSTNPIPNGINSHEPEGHPPGAFIVNPYDAKKYAKSVAPNGGLINQAVQDIHFFAPISDPPPGTYLGPLNDVKEAMPKFLTPLNIRGLKLKNRIALSPMSQSSAEPGTGTPNTWHLVHYGQFALRGAALIMTEATAIAHNGRMTTVDTGIYTDEHVQAWRKITDFVHANGCYMGCQLNHAGRRGNLYSLNIIATNPDLSLYECPEEAGGCGVVWGPSPIRYDAKYPLPREMTLDDITELKENWKKAVQRANEARFDVLEIHASHGYLLHAFLSPLANQRKDKYGGSLENRMRLTLEIAELTRKLWPQDRPVFLRLSVTDWHKKGEKSKANPKEYLSWGIEQSNILVGELIKLGIDFIDVTSGGMDPDQSATNEPGHNISLAREIRKNHPNVLLGCVGLIKTGQDVEKFISNGDCDLVDIGRQFLREADFVHSSAKAFGAMTAMPNQYAYAAFYPGKLASMVLHEGQVIEETVKRLDIQTPGPTSQEKH